MNPYLYKKLILNTFSVQKFATLTQKYISLAILAVALLNMFFPHVLQAVGDSQLKNMLVPANLSQNEVVTEYDSDDYPNQLPLSESLPARYEVYVDATAYNSLEAQTDDTPCITANGFDVCEHGIENIIATNYLPLGAKVRFPDLYGDKIFYNMDRMNSRYYQRVDFWMLERSDAIAFGLKRIRMEVL